VRESIESIGGGAARLGLRPAPVVAELWRSYVSLADDDARRAFLRTLRAVVDPRGQAVSASNRLHLAAEVPTLIVWGDADPIIPVDHAHAAHASIPGSRLEIFEGVGHYPHCEAPERFVEVLTEFIETTVPARITVAAHHVVHQTVS
jgi:pimeloyl-ACP methyl ester carboxylesterase